MLYYWTNKNWHVRERILLANTVGVSSLDREWTINYNKRGWKSTRYNTVLFLRVIPTYPNVGHFDDHGLLLVYIALRISVLKLDRRQVQYIKREHRNFQTADTRTQNHLIIGLYYSVFKHEFPAFPVHCCSIQLFEGNRSSSEWGFRLGEVRTGTIEKNNHNNNIPCKITQFSRPRLSSNCIGECIRIIYWYIYIV